jgi:hypothetical protein
VLGLAGVFVLGPPGLREPNRTLALTEILQLQGKPQPEYELLQAFARVHLRHAGDSESAMLEEAARGASNSLPIEWRLAAGYFLALHQLQVGQANRAAATLERTASTHDEPSTELELYQQDELGRLKREVQAAIHLASPH